MYPEYISLPSALSAKTSLLFLSLISPNISWKMCPLICNFDMGSLLFVYIFVPNCTLSHYFCSHLYTVFVVFSLSIFVQKATNILRELYSDG